MKNTFTDIFFEAERKAMAFLTSEYSFIVSDRRVIGGEKSQYIFGTATYAESKLLNKTNYLGRFVRLSVAPLRLELDLYIGAGDDRNDVYSICELHNIIHGGEFPRRQHNLYEAMHDVSQLQAEFEILTQVLRTCGSRFFAGDKSLWEELKKHRIAVAQRQEDIYASREAEKAFKSKQWDVVVSLLTPRECRLSNVDAAKLSYARKHRVDAT